MVFQAYLLFFLVTSIICIICIARNFYNEYPADKQRVPSFWLDWMKFPSTKNVVMQEYRSLLVGLYYIQAILFVILVIALIFGDYTF